MPLPAVLAGIGSALTSETFLGLVGGLLPSVISALVGSPTEEEARTKVKPQRDEMLAKLMAQGLDQQQAEKLADDSIAAEVQRLQAEGGLNPWLEGALSIGGGLLGWKAGNWLKGGGAAKAAAGAPAIADAAKAAAPEIGTPFLGSTSGSAFAWDPAHKGGPAPKTLLDPHGDSPFGWGWDEAHVPKPQTGTAAHSLLGEVGAIEPSPFSPRQRDSLPSAYQREPNAIPRDYQPQPMPAEAPRVAITPPPGVRPVAPEPFAASPFAWADDVSIQHYLPEPPPIGPRPFESSIPPDVAPPSSPFVDLPTPPMRPGPSRAEQAMAREAVQQNRMPIEDAFAAMEAERAAQMADMFAARRAGQRQQVRGYGESLL